jgi:hypothetical protein
VLGFRRVSIIFERNWGGGGEGGKRK